MAGSGPMGRYVEFGYLQERLNGSTTSNLNPLLATVRDVRGNTWMYAYYGQNVGENDSNQQNFLTEFRSPGVDTLGSHMSGLPLLRTKQTYTINGATVTNIHQERGKGLLTTDWGFQPGART